MASEVLGSRLGTDRLDRDCTREEVPGRLAPRRPMAAAMVTTTLQGAFQATWSETEPRQSRFSPPLPGIPQRPPRRRLTIQGRHIASPVYPGRCELRQRGSACVLRLFFARCAASWLLQLARTIPGRHFRSCVPGAPSDASSGASITETKMNPWSRPRRASPAESALNASSDPSMHSKIGEFITYLRHERRPSDPGAPVPSYPSSAYPRRRGRRLPRQPDIRTFRPHGNGIGRHDRAGVIGQGRRCRLNRLVAGHSFTPYVPRRFLGSWSFVAYGTASRWQSFETTFG